MNLADFSLRFPRLDLGSIPDKDKDNANSLDRTLQRLTDYVETFASALKLVEFCDTLQGSDKIGERLKDDSVGWSMIAARDAAMTIYHIHEAMNSITTIVRDTNSIKRKIDTKLLEAEKSAYKSAFPFRTRIRHSVAHSATHVATPEKISNHRVSGSLDIPGIRIEHAETILVTNTMLGRSFNVTHGRELISYELTVGSLQTMSEIVRRFCSAFTQVFERQPGEPPGSHPAPQP